MMIIFFYFFLLILNFSYENYLIANQRISRKVKIISKPIKKLTLSCLLLLLVLLPLLLLLLSSSSSGGGII